MPKNNVTRFVNSHNYDQSYRAQWTDDGFNHLRTYLGRVRFGQPLIYEAPFAKGESMEQILTEWWETLESLRTKWPSLCEFEEDLAKKVGPLSVELPLDQRLGDVAHYYEDILLSSTPIDKQAIDAVCNEWAGLRGLRLRSQREVVANMKLSTNSGAPYFAKRRTVVKGTVPCLTDVAGDRHPMVYVSSPWRRGDWRPTSAVIGWRGQEGGPDPDDVKQRVVWMFPMAVNIAEHQVYQPMIQGAQRLGLVPAWISNERVDREITNLFDSKGSNDLVICTDFTRFDQHFNPDLQQCAQTILSSFLGWDADDWFQSVFPAKYMIPLAWNYGKRFKDEWYVSYFEGRHGMASGSAGTNADETIVHRALQYESAFRKGTKLNPHSQCLGDDGVLTYPGITVDDVVRNYESHGQECNHSKQYASKEDCVYLRRWHHRDYRVDKVCVGVYSTCRALGRLRYIERFIDPEVWTVENVALRQLSILENTVYHPLFHEFVKFCMKRDKYRLGIDIPGFLRDIDQVAAEATDLMPDFLGYNRTVMSGQSPVSQWEVVKYLKSIK